MPASTASARPTSRPSLVVLPPEQGGPHATRSVDRRDQPIGVFDSGVGGLTVAREIVALLPHENVVYLADSANCPYGPRPDAEVRQLAQNCADFLLDRGAKIIVVACNTASAAGLGHLRERYGPAVPIVGLVPAVKPAVAASRSGRIGVLATRGTMRGSLLGDVIAQYAAPAGVEVLLAVPAGLVEAAEAGDLHGPTPRRILHEALAPLLARGVDTLVLGCTHYPLFKPLIAVLAPDLAVLDSGPGVARRVRYLLEQSEQLNQQPESGRFDVFTSGSPAAVAPVVTRLLGSETSVAHAAIPILIPSET